MLVTDYMLSSNRSSGVIKTGFCGISRKPEVIDGELGGVLLCAPRPMQRYMDIIHGRFVTMVGRLF